MSNNINFEEAKRLIDDIHELSSRWPAKRLAAIIGQTRQAQTKRLSNKRKAEKGNK